MNRLQTDEHRCIGIWGFLFGHNYVGRCHHENITPPKIAEAAASLVKELIVKDAYIPFMEDQISTIMDGFNEMNSVKNTYIHDVCTRCGNIVQKS